MKQTWRPANWLDILKTRRWAGLGLAAVLGLCGLLVWAVIPKTHTITVNGLSQALTFRTTAKDLGAALRAQNVELSPKDVVTPALNTSLKGQKALTVDVKKATSVTVYVDGKTLTVETQSPTVAGLLEELAIGLGEKDTISADLGGQLTNGAELRVVRRSERITVMSQEIPYEVEREEDRTMMAGETKVVQEGTNGLRQIKSVTYLEDGQEVATETVEDTVVTAPVNQVVAYGTGGVVSRGGREYRYAKVLTMESTGYTAGKESNPNGNGYTYLELKAERGIVAVDPNVIPLRTRLYVEGYGPAYAGDIGGAIKGMKIDLCFDDLNEALIWGRRPVTVYILDE